MASAWIPVSEKKPTCPRDSLALGTPVLIWPRNPDTIRGGGVDGFAYYGKRATGRPAFYLHGAELHGITHWRPMPDGPDSCSTPQGLPEEVSDFIRYVTLEIQQHRSRTDAQKDDLFQRAYRLYAKYKVEGEGVTY